MRLPLKLYKIKSLQETFASKFKQPSQEGHVKLKHSPGAGQHQNVAPLRVRKTMKTRNSALSEDNAQPFTCLSILFMKIPAN